ncbi:MAG: N-acetylmuramoyl-L-alanine amidase [Erysipelotrichaceae bacterium]
MAKRRGKRRVRPIFKVIGILILGCMICFGIIVILNLLVDDRQGEIEVIEQDETIVEEVFEPYIIAIDCGHGGIDVGVTGLVVELEVNQVTTAYLYELLDADPMYEPILVNENNEFMSTEERRDFAIENEVDFLISIHCNYSESSNATYGFEIYPQNTDHPYYDVSYSIAQSIAEKYIEEGHSPRIDTGLFYAHYVEYEPGEFQLYVFSESDEAITNITGDSFGVLIGETYPAILVEQGYVYNESDVETWLSDEGCQKSAQIFYEAIQEAFN